jgi:photosystem II stability/assembly factor-like uncharacterized protein
MFTNLRGQWEILNEGGHFETIQFVNNEIGWIVGGGNLLKTEDGGETWYTLSTDENIQIHKIDFINESVGWAIGRLSPWVSFHGGDVVIKYSLYLKLRTEVKLGLLKKNFLKFV